MVRNRQISSRHQTQAQVFQKIVTFRIDNLGIYMSIARSAFLNSRYFMITLWKSLHILPILIVPASMPEGDSLWVWWQLEAWYLTHCTDMGVVSYARTDPRLSTKDAWIEPAVTKVYETFSTNHSIVSRTNLVQCRPYRSIRTLRKTYLWWNAFLFSGHFPF